MTSSAADLLRSRPAPRFLAPLCRGLGLIALGLLALTGHAQDFTYSTYAGIASRTGNLSGTGGGQVAPMFNNPYGIAIGPDGALYVTEVGNSLVRKVTTAGVVTTFAGNANIFGATDGTTDATFNGPQGVAVDSSGNVYVADYSSNTIRKITSAGVVSTFAGTAGTSGSADATGTAARFFSPSGLAVDSSGNVYVADTDNHTIRKITPAGVVTTVAGTAGSAGDADGNKATARLNSPRAVAVDAGGNLYVADNGNNAVRKVDTSGAITTLAGKAGTFGSVDGIGAAARFNLPTGIAIDSAGNLYVAEQPTSVIRKVTPAGVVTTLAGTATNSGRTDATGAAARFDRPTSVAVDSAGNVYVTDYANQLIRKITAAGVVSTLAGTGGVAGYQDGTGYLLSPSMFRNPSSATFDAAGNLYIADTNNNSIRKISRGGIVTLLAGNGSSAGTGDGTGTDARFNGPAGIVAASDGTLYVADTGNHTIRKVTSAGVVTLYAGVVGSRGNADGAAASATFSFPSGLALDSSGNLYVADYGNQVIRKISPGGIVSTLAGTAGDPGSADGVGAAARFKYPRDVAIDSSGNLYVADSGNHTIRRVSPAGLVTTIAGSAGAAGAVDGSGNVARFNGPSGVGVDSAGNVYVADSANSTLRKISVSGTVSTVGGLAGKFGTADGVGTNARFNRPTDIAVDAYGNLFVADTRNHTVRVGVLPGNTTPNNTGDVNGANGAPIGSGSGNGSGSGSGNGSGTGGSGSTGDGATDDGTTTGTGFLLRPSSIAVDALGYYYVADTANHCIRRISTTREVTVFAGQSGSSGSTDGSGTAARFNSPTGLAFDAGGNLFVTDTGNSTIRKITSSGDVTTFAGTAGSTGSTDGTGTAARFNSPKGIAVDTSSNDVYVTDSVNNTIRKITSAQVVTTVAGTAGATGYADGVGAAARFNNPTGLAIAASFNLIVADTFNHTIRFLRTRDQTATNADGSTSTLPAGEVITLAGTAGVAGVYDGVGYYALFNAPQGVSVNSSSGVIYVADTGNSAIRRVNTIGAVSTIAGLAGVSGKRNGSGDQALFNQPQAVLPVSSALIVVDTANSVLRTVLLPSSATAYASVSTVALTAPTTTTPSTGGGSSGGGGGGAPSTWFIGALAILGLARGLRRRA